MALSVQPDRTSPRDAEASGLGSPSLTTLREHIHKYAPVAPLAADTETADQSTPTRDVPKQPNARVTSSMVESDPAPDAHVPTVSAKPPAETDLDVNAEKSARRASIEDWQPDPILQAEEERAGDDPNNLLNNPARPDCVAPPLVQESRTIDVAVSPHPFRSLVSVADPQTGDGVLGVEPGEAIAWESLDRYVCLCMSVCLSVCCLRTGRCLTHSTPAPTRIRWPLLLWPVRRKHQASTNGE